MINLRFESAALATDTFQILQFDGEEEISRLFRFELRLVSRDPNIDFLAVLESRAHIAITTRDQTRYIHGMLSEFEQGSEWQNGLYEYRAVLVPRLWIMSQSTQNQIYQNQTVPDIVESELRSIEQKGGHPVVTDGLGVDDYQIYTIRDYEEREYVVQFKESDLNFISRLMEHEGMHYFFEQDEDREKLVITDAMATDELEGLGGDILFQTVASASLYDRNVVYKLSRSQKQVPDSVLVTDFNYRNPSLPMQSDNSPVVENGVGFVTEFGAHFKKPEQGQVLASIRAEEYRCQQNIYTGESNIAAFSCGGLYSLSQHFRQDYNQSYLITKVRHHASQEIESWGNVGSTKYSNEFSCIPSGLTYRPSRITPKPRLYGIMNGTIDSEQDLGRADIDEQGRYKVKMPFDIGGAAPGQASRRIRMAQPYGGSGDDGQGAGMSFPLIKGAEVIWTCIDGDIDRPIITGVVPNPLQPSPTNTQNATSNVIKTTSGITMTFNDGIGGLNQNNSQSGPNIANQQNAQRLPVEQDLVNEQSQSEYRLGTENAEDVRQALQQQQQLVNVDTKSEMDSFFLSGVSGGAETEVGSEVNLQFKVPHIVNDYSGDDPDPRTRGKASVSGNSYLHMGDIPADWLYTDNYGAVEIRNGWFDYTDGDHVSVTQGKRTDIVKGGDYKQIISKGSVMGEDAATLHFDKFRKVGNGWRRTTAGYLSSDTYTWGDSEEFFGGFKFDGMAGLSTSAFIGGNCDLAIGANVNMQLAYDVNLGMASEFSYVAGSKYSITKDEAIEAREKIELYVEDSKGTDSMSKTFAAAIGVGTVVGGLTGVIGAASSALGRSVNKFDGEETAMASSIGAAAGLYAGAIAASIMAKKKKVSADQRETQIVLDDKKVTLQAGNGKLDKPSDTKFSSIVLETKSIKLTVGTSSITIKDKLVEFNAEEFKFTAGGSILDLKKDAGLDLKGEKGITVAKGGIVVTKGVIETKRGDVKCTKMEANELKTTSLAG